MPQGFSELAKLHHVNSTLTSLDFRDEALMALQTDG
jgi:hypothetical protein